MATRALRQLTFGQSKSAGRNSAGRITIFHRGGGAKRLQRVIDLKRSTSAMGVVERIEYDPNRSSRIALVRWTQGVERTPPRRRHTAAEEQFAFAPPRELLKPSAATIRGEFSFRSLPGMVDRRNQPYTKPAKADHVMIGLPTREKDHPVYVQGTKARATTKLSSPKEVFFSAFAKGDSGGFSRLPRMAVAGARPPYFATRIGGGDDEKKNTFSLSEVQEWDTGSVKWAHKIKRKAALPW